MLRLHPWLPRLRLLVLALHDRCDQTCVHCSIWRGSGAAPLSRDGFLRVVEEAIAAGIREALLTGGEPLLSDALGPVTERLKRSAVRVSLATGGQALERRAAELRDRIDEVYVSLDGSATVHDRLRGKGSAERLRRGLRALRQVAPGVRQVARCTLQAANLDEVPEVVSHARSLGVDALSFLPLDAHSTAFGAHPAARRPGLPAPDQVDRFEALVDALAPDLVLEPPAKLRRIAAHLRASIGAGTWVRPECDAPLWSLVVEPDGRVRPCFFQAPVGDARLGLSRARGAIAPRRLDAETCRRCVCPKRREGNALSRALA